MSREVTFIECNDMDFSYTSKARLHNGKIRRLNALGTNVQKNPTSNSNASTQMLCRHGSVSSSCISCHRHQNARNLSKEYSQILPQNTSQGLSPAYLDLNSIRAKQDSPLGFLSSYQRDLFNAYPMTLTFEDQRLIQHWFSIVEDLYYTPKIAGEFSVRSPVNIIFQTALCTKAALECMVLLPAAKHLHAQTADTNPAAAPEIWRYCARAFACLNEIIGNAFTNRVLPFEDKMGCTILKFSLVSDGRPDAIRAHKAVVTARVAVAEHIGKVHQDVNSPLQGWTRVLTATDLWDYNESLQTPRAQKIIKSRFYNLFNFLRNAQALSLASSPGRSSPSVTCNTQPCFQRPAISQSSALYKILTCLSHLPPIRDSLPVPFKDFLYSSHTELLIYIHLHLLNRQRCPKATREFIDDLHAKAEEAAKALAATKPSTRQPSLTDTFHPLRTMLWLVYSDPTLHTKQVRANANEWNLPLKYWQNGPSPWPVDYLVAWLVSDENKDGSVNLPLLDVDALKESVWSTMNWLDDDPCGFYKPAENEAFDFV